MLVPHICHPLANVGYGYLDRQRIKAKSHICLLRQMWGTFTKHPYANCVMSSATLGKSVSIFTSCPGNMFSTGALERSFS